MGSHRGIHDVLSIMSGIAVVLHFSYALSLCQSWLVIFIVAYKFRINLVFGLEGFHMVYVGETYD